MKSYILLLISTLTLLLLCTSEANAKNICSPSIEEMKTYVEKGREYLPDCLKNKPRIKQRNNYNVRQRGSDIIYYSQPVDDCHENCMSMFAKCTSNISFDKFGVIPDETFYEDSWSDFSKRINQRNQLSRCTHALDRCLDNCPQASRPPPIDDGREPDGDDEEDSDINSIHR